LAAAYSKRFHGMVQTGPGPNISFKADGFAAA
jgi:hypothetical protein